MSGQAERPVLPWLDLEALRDRLDQDDSVIRELLRIFLTDAQEKVAEIRRAMAAADSERILDLAHALYGASGNVSATALRASAGEIEACLREGPAVDLPRRVEALQRELRRFCRSWEALSW